MQAQKVKTENAKPKPKQVTGLRLNEQEASALREQAEREGITLTALIRRFMYDSFLEEFFTTE